MPKFRLKLRWWLAPFLACAAPVAAWFAADVYFRHCLARTRALFAENGHPVEINQLFPQGVAVEKNAALLIVRAQTAIKNLPTRKTEHGDTDAMSDVVDLCIDLPDHIAESPARGKETLNQLQLLLSEPAIVELLELTREASELTSFAPQVDYTAGPEAAFGNHVSTMRHLLRLLAARATVNIHSGADSAVIWGDLLACDRLSMLAAQGPTLIDLLTSVACSGITQNACIEALNAGVVPPDPQAAIEHYVQTLADLRLRMPRAMAAERMIFLDWIADRFLEGSSARESDFALILPETAAWGLASRLPHPVSRTWATADLTVLYRAHFDLAQITRNSPGHVWPAAFAEINARVGEHRWPLATTFLIFRTVALTELADQAARRLLTIAIALAARKQTTGEWTEDLAMLHLPDDVLIDPSSGHPIRSTRVADRLRLYADGPDGKDDGGRTWQAGENRSIEVGDIVVELNLSR